MYFPYPACCDITCGELFRDKFVELWSGVFCRVVILLFGMDYGSSLHSYEEGAHFVELAWKVHEKEKCHGHSCGLIYYRKNCAGILYIWVGEKIRLTILHTRLQTFQINSEGSINLPALASDSAVQCKPDAKGPLSYIKIKSFGQYLTISTINQPWGSRRHRRTYLNRKQKDPKIKGFNKLSRKGKPGLRPPLVTYTRDSIFLELVRVPQTTWWSRNELISFCYLCAPL